MSARVAIKKDSSLLRAQITQPVSGTILALDPDIPPQHQRVPLQLRWLGAAQAPQTGSQRVRWVLVTRQPQPARQEIGRGNSVDWLPWPGRHRLELQDAAGRVLDSVELEVRGAAARAAP